MLIHGSPNTRFGPRKPLSLNKGAGVLLNPPYTEVAMSLAPAVYASGGQLYTSFKVADHRPAPGKIYLVDPTRPDNSGDGLTWATAKRDVSNVLPLTDWDTIICDDNNGAGRDYFGPRGWYGTNCVRGGSIITRNGGRVRFVKSLNPTFAWTLYSGNTYRIQLPLANATKTVDLSRKDADGIYEILTDAPDLATCLATPGSQFHDGTYRYVTASDLRNLVGDLNMVPLDASANNGRWSPITSVDLYIGPNIEFVGGTRPFYALITTTGILPRLFVDKEAKFMGSAGVNNGISFEGPGELYVEDTLVGGNARDNYNLHGNANGNCKGFLIRPRNGYCGTDPTDTSSNLFTTHEGCGLTIVGATKPTGTSKNSVVAAINTSRIWIAGGSIPKAAATSGSSAAVTTGDTAEVSMDTVTIEHNAAATDLVAAGGPIRYTNMSIAGLTTSGTVSAYVRP